MNLRLNSVFQRNTILLSLGFIIISVLYVNTAISIFNSTDPAHWNDTWIYEAISTAPLDDPYFWASSRPLTLPLFYKLLPDTENYTITNYQMVFSIVAYLYFAGAVAFVIRNPVMKLVSFASVLALSLTTDFFLWHRHLLSESVSFSLFAIVLGTWIVALHLLGRRENLKFYFQIALGIGLMLLTALWSFTRDSNAYIVLGITGIVIPVVILWRRSLRKWLPLAITLFVCALTVYYLQNYTANRAFRWRYSLMTVVTNRILVDGEKSQFMAERGMPNDETVASFRGVKWPEQGGDWSAVFNDWLVDGGARADYAMLLLSEPRYNMQLPLDYGGFANPELSLYIDWGQNYPTDLQTTLNDIFYYPGGIWQVTIFFTLFALYAWLLYRRAWRPEWLVPIFVLLMVYPIQFFTYHADATDVDRHMLSGALMIRLGVLLLLAFGIDRVVTEVLEMRYTRRHDATTHIEPTLARDTNG